MKICTVCGIELVSLINWYPSYEEQHKHKCIICVKREINIWRRKTKEKRNLYQKSIYPQYKQYYQNYYHINGKKLKEMMRGRIQKIRFEVLEHYSNGKLKCACCGENHIEFLAIDHINGNGNAEKKRLNLKGHNFLYWLKKNNYPEGYRVLCHNCNQSNGFYGYCPHEIDKNRSPNNE